MLLTSAIYSLQSESGFFSELETGFLISSETCEAPRARALVFNRYGVPLQSCSPLLETRALCGGPVPRIDMVLSRVFGSLLLFSTFSALCALAADPIAAQV